MPDTFPTITPITPLTLGGAATPDSPVVVEVVSPTLVEGETLIVINNQDVYSDSQAAAGYGVTVTPISQGYRYTVTPVVPFAYDSENEVLVYASDIGGTDRVAWKFSVVDDPTCFVGPLNALELSLLVPFALATATQDHPAFLQTTELLRGHLLDCAVSSSNANAAVRTLFLQTSYSDLKFVLRGTEHATLTDSEKAVRLCHKNTLLQQAELLKPYFSLIDPAVRELRAVGLPQKHVELFQRYLDTGTPAVWVPLACVVILLAKLLENEYLGIHG